MIKIWNKLYINWITLPFAGLLFLPDLGSVMGIAYVSILVHELFHCMGCVALKVKIKRLILLPFGVMMETEERCINDPSKETVICLLGPIGNLILIISGIIILPESGIYMNQIKVFTETNWVIFIINMLPIIPLDGGRILKCYFVEKWGIIQAYNFVKKISWIAISILMVFGLWVLIETRLNMSYVFIACVLLYSLICEDKHMAGVTAKEMMYAKEKLRKRNLMKTTGLVISENTPVYKIVNMFSYNCYYIVNVVDDETSRIIKTYTEPQVVDLLLNFGNKIKFSDILSC